MRKNDKHRVSIRWVVGGKFMVSVFCPNDATENGFHIQWEREIGRNLEVVCNECGANINKNFEQSQRAVARRASHVRM